MHSDNLGTLARAFSPQPLPDLEGSLVGTVGLGANFDSKVYRAAVRLSDLRLHYQGHDISSREPVVAEVTPERVTLRSFYLGEPGTENELVVSGGFGLKRGVPLDLRFQSTLAASWAELFLPGTKVQGGLEVLGSVRGTVSAPLLSGQGEIRNGQVIVAGLAQAFDGVTGTLSFDRDRVILDELNARFGGGTLRASGSFSLPGGGRETAYRFDVKAKDISMRFPDFLLNRGDAELSLISNGNGGGRQVVGQVNLQRALYVEDITVDPLLLLQRLILSRQRLLAPETDDFQSTTPARHHGQRPGCAARPQQPRQPRGRRRPDHPRQRRPAGGVRQGDGQSRRNPGVQRQQVRGAARQPVVRQRHQDRPGDRPRGADGDPGLRRHPQPRRHVREARRPLRLRHQPRGPGALLSRRHRPAPVGRGRLHAPPPTADQQAAPGDVARQFLYGQAASALTKRVGTLFGFDRFRIDPLTSAVGQPSRASASRSASGCRRTSSSPTPTDPTNNRQSIVQVEWQLRKNVSLVLTQVGDGTYTIDAQWERRF